VGVVDDAVVAGGAILTRAGHHLDVHHARAKTPRARVSIGRGFWPITVSPGGDRLVVSSGTKLVGLDSRSWREAWSVEIGHGLARGGDGAVVLTDSRRAELLDAASGRSLGSTEAGSCNVVGNGLLVTTDSSRITVVRLATGAIWRRIEPPLSQRFGVCAAVGRGWIAHLLEHDETGEHQLVVEELEGGARRAMAVPGGGSVQLHDDALFFVGFDGLLGRVR
jgi:hypothetical protein